MTRLSLILVFLLNILVNYAATPPKDGIAGADLPRTMRSGFTHLFSAENLLASTCRDIVENNQHIVSSASDSIEGGQEVLGNLERAMALNIKPKLTESFRQSDIIDSLILPSGFTLDDQSLLKLAGCYIRLGINLRGLKSQGNEVPSRLAATALLNGGNLYAQNAGYAEGFEKVSSLLSAAQCYYWALHNEHNIDRKAHIFRLASIYIARAREEATLPQNEESIFQLADIARIESLLKETP